MGVDWRSEGSFTETVLSFCFYKGSRVQSQVIRLTWCVLTCWAILLVPISVLIRKMRLREIVTQVYLAPSSKSIKSLDKT